MEDKIYSIGQASEDHTITFYKGSEDRTFSFEGTNSTLGTIFEKEGRMCLTGDAEACAELLCQAKPVIGSGKQFSISLDSEEAVVVFGNPPVIKGSTDENMRAFLTYVNQLVQA